MALCTCSRDSPGISHVQEHAYTHKQMHTHTPHTPWETVKGLISFGECRERCIFNVYILISLSVCVCARAYMYIYAHTHTPMGFPGGSVVKNPACQCRRHGLSPWVGKFPWRRKWHATPVFLPREAHGQRSLVGYSPLGRKELDTTEQHDTVIISKVLNSSFFLSFLPLYSLP